MTVQLNEGMEKRAKGSPAKAGKAVKSPTLSERYDAWMRQRPTLMILLTVLLAIVAAVLMLLAGHPQRVLYQGF